MKKRVAKQQILVLSDTAKRRYSYWTEACLGVRLVLLESCGFGVEVYGQLRIEDLCLFLDLHGGDPGILEGVSAEDRIDVVWPQVAAILESDYPINVS